jgi:DNA-binding CsgD family transcriptional regulator
MPDLTRLTDAERRALALLAQGHTAKSAAVALGVSEGAVNERLREARRKTGVGSSRQLARLAASDARPFDAGPAGPQETWDEKIGVGAPRPTSHGGRRNLSTRAAWPLLAGASMIVALAASIGAFAALAVADRPAPTPAPAPPTSPRVITVSPAPGAVVPAGRLALTVTFDQPMQAGWSFVARDPGLFPACASTPLQSKDRRSFTLACTVQARRDYEIGFNNDRYRKFASEAGVPAVPATVRFTAR